MKKGRARSYDHVATLGAHPQLPLRAVGTGISRKSVHPALLSCANDLFVPDLLHRRSRGIQPVRYRDLLRINAIHFSRAKVIPSGLLFSRDWAHPLAIRTDPEGGRDGRQIPPCARMFNRTRWTGVSCDVSHSPLHRRETAHHHRRHIPRKGHNFHYHSNQEEVLYVVSGTVEQWLERERRTLGPGDSIFIRLGRACLVCHRC